MFCHQCGKKVDEDSIYCGNCGAKLKMKTEEQPTQESTASTVISAEDKSDDTNITHIDINTPLMSDYVFLNDIPYRDMIPKILKYIHNGIDIIGVLLFLVFVKEQIDEGANYKIMIYVIRYIINFALLFLSIEIIKQIIILFKIKYSDIKNNTKKTIILVWNIMIILLLIIGTYILKNPSNLTILELYGAIANDFIVISLIETILAFKVPLLFFVVCGILEEIQIRFFIEYEEEKTIIDSLSQ